MKSKVPGERLSFPVKALSFPRGLVQILLSVGGVVASEELRADPLDNWVIRDSGTTTLLRGITYANGKFVAVGDMDVTDFGAIVTSPDGANWSVQSPPSPARYFLTLYGVCYGSGTYAAVGWYNTLYTSSDGMDWVYRRIQGQAITFTDVTFGNGRFVAVGLSNRWHE